MNTVTVSPKFQVVISQKVRETLGIRAGQKIQVLVCEGRIELIPFKPVCELRGAAPGINTTIERESDRT